MQIMPWLGLQSYSTGKYMTGIKGIESYIGKEKKEIISILTNELHGFGDKMSTDDLNDLALFVSKGQVDFTKFIDPETNLVKIGNVEKGKEYFETVCAKCHGKNGKLIEDMAPLGKLAHKNPWEVLHKIINGQPGKNAFSSRIRSRCCSRHYELYSNIRKINLEKYLKKDLFNLKLTLCEDASILLSTSLAYL